MGFLRAKPIRIVVIEGKPNKIIVSKECSITSSGNVIEDLKHISEAYNELNEDLNIRFILEDKDKKKKKVAQ